MPPKIQSIVVAGNTNRLSDDKQFLHNLSRWLPVDAMAYVFTNNDSFDQNFLGTTKIVADKFFAYTKKTLSDLKTGDVFHFIQMGHGDEGPRMILEEGWGGKSIFDGELTRLFADNVKKDEKPFISIILRGCYSGGFSKYFWNQNGEEVFVPDFFLGGSPPGSVAWVNSTPLSDDTPKRCDFNKDSVVTLHESGVCYLNGDYNHFGIMFSKRGSPDISINGTPAIKPYFPKTVEKLNGHKAFIDALESLRFGEQMVVLFEGQKLDAKLSDWFKSEAENGDGYYKFVMVPDNEESRKFFNSENSAAFVVGPNLEYKGERLKEYVPVGDQIPYLLSTQNFYYVLSDWKHKLSEAEASRISYNLEEMMRGLVKNPEVVVKKVRPFLTSEKREEVEQGLLYLSGIFNAAGLKLISELTKDILDVASRVADGRLELGEQSKRTLFTIFQSLPKTDEMLAIAERLRGREGNVSQGETCLVTRGVNAENFKALLQAAGSMDLDQLNRLADTLKCTRLEIEQDKQLVVELSKNIRSSNNPAVRLAAAEMIQEYRLSWYYKKEAAELIPSEKDDAILVYLLAWGGSNDEILARENFLRTSSEKDNGEVGKLAKAMVKNIDDSRKARQARIDKFYSDNSLKLRLSGGFGFFTAFDEGEYSTSGLSYYGYLPFQQILAASDDEKRQLHLGVRPMLSLDFSWERGWAGLMGAVEAFVQLDTGIQIAGSDYHPFTLSFILGGGVAAEYLPFRDLNSVNTGYSFSLEIFGRSIYREFQKEYVGMWGGALRFFYFPDTNSYAGTIGFILNAD